MATIKHHLTKIQIGIRKTNERRKPRETNFNDFLGMADANKLLQYGTCDRLAKLHNYNTKPSKVEHPTDKGYFKDVLILSTLGQRALKYARLKVNRKRYYNSYFTN